jgi:hypothetical protein
LLFGLSRWRGLMTSFPQTMKLWTVRLDAELESFCLSELRRADRSSLSDLYI